MSAPANSIDERIASIVRDALDEQLQPVREEIAALHRMVAESASAGNSDGYLTVSDVAAQLQVEPQTVGRWIRSGRLKAVGPKRAKRVTRSALWKFMSSSDGTRAETNLDSLADAALRRRDRR